jgi:diamine N-acetyltransferase
MTVRYRRGIVGDAASLAALFGRSFTETFGQLYSPEDLAAFLGTKTERDFRGELADDRFEFLLAEHGTGLGGYAKLGPADLPVETPSGTVELRQLYVLKEHQGSGIAAELMRRALEWARLKGARHVQLSVYVDNHRARRFYERYGFEPVGSYDFMVGAHADRDIVLRHVVMQADE